MLVKAGLTHQHTETELLSDHVKEESVADSFQVEVIKDEWSQFEEETMMKQKCTKDVFPFLLPENECQQLMALEDCPLMHEPLVIIHPVKTIKKVVSEDELHIEVGCDLSAVKVEPKEEIAFVNSTVEERLNEPSTPSLSVEESDPLSSIAAELSEVPVQQVMTKCGNVLAVESPLMKRCTISINCNPCRKPVQLQSYINEQASSDSRQNACKIFRTRSLLSSHIDVQMLKDQEVQHSVNSSEEVCHFEECGKCFSDQYHLKNHLRIHSDEKDYECNDCGRCFTECSSLKRHLKIHSGEKNYKCEKCDKSFSRPDQLKSHIRIHSDMKYHKCEECGKCFIQLDYLKNHLKFHSDKKNYKCKQCGKYFSRSSDLIRHLRIHSGEKNFSCVECGRYFTERGNLKTHLRIHTGEKDYKCKECGKCFRRSSDLKRHLRIHPV